jgi:hypothetical protein
MKRHSLLIVAMVLIAGLFVACFQGPEEDGTQYAIGETATITNNGVELIISFNSDSSKFIGTVENITTATIQQVRVESHLSNGIELGPTTPADLLASAIRNIELDAVGQTFTTWSVHAEVGASSGGGEGGTEGPEGPEGSDGD